MAIELAAAKSHRPLVMRLLFVTDPAARLCGLGCDVDTAPMQARLNVAPWLRVLSAAEECSGLLRSIEKYICVHHHRHAFADQMRD